MTSTKLATIANPDLTVRFAERAPYNAPETRRWGFHNLHRIARYGVRLRARNVLVLKREFDMRIEAIPEVQRLTSTTMFSGMAVIRDGSLLFERYAPDFGPARPHAIMSISKTMMHLIYGQLVDAGLDLAGKVKEHLPEIGSGYAEATIRDVLDMNVANRYTNSFEQEVAIGWQLPAPGAPEETNQAFLCDITSEDIVNHGESIDYKSANTDVLGWIAERFGARSVRDYLVEIAESAGIEDSLYVTTDRTGVPILHGGCSLTARDLARYGQIFARGGEGVDGQRVGSGAFLEDAIEGPGKHESAPHDWMKYRAQLVVVGRSIGHGGYAGQFLYVNLDTRVSVAFFSVLETLHGGYVPEGVKVSGSDEDYSSDVVRMAQAITELPYE